MTLAHRSTAAIIVALALLLLAENADAARRQRWCWPFDFSCHHRSQQKAPRVRARKPADPAVSLPPDCEQINNAVKALSPERLARALLRSTKKQKATIAKCAAQEGQP